MYPIEDAGERMTVEVVFGLTGGELESKPLRFLARKAWTDGTPRDGHSRWWRRYWYTGAPDYAQAIERRWRGDVMTIVSDELFGMLPRKIHARGKVWRKVARFASSGEAECYGHGAPVEGAEDCPICGASPGEDHGYAYVGGGWGESVYVAR